MSISAHYPVGFFMPGRIPKPCRQARCPNTTINANGYCDQHHECIKRHRPKDKRPSAYRRGYTSQWQKARCLFLRDEPLCRECAMRGWVVTATVVDHITPHEGDPMKFWNRSNWQPLCKRCHDHKTATEEHTTWY